MASPITLLLATAIGFTVWQDGKALLLKTLHLLISGMKNQIGSKPKANIHIDGRSYVSYRGDNCHNVGTLLVFWTKCAYWCSSGMAYTQQKVFLTRLSTHSMVEMPLFGVTSHNP